MKDEQILSIAKSLAEDFLTQLGLDAEVKVSFGDDDNGRNVTYVNIQFLGDNLNELIGHHGKNLESIQVILGLMLSKELQVEDDIRILLEVNDYKESRERYLKSYALRAADQVKESGQEMELPPMKPSERRVVHMCLKQEEGIVTESVGEGEDRRIIIKKAA